MSEVTPDPDGPDTRSGESADSLLPFVYEELRRLAVNRMAKESPGQTLQPTALVHEAWQRVVGGGQRRFSNRAHFFACAAEAMRRILIERARRRQVLAKGGFSQRDELTESKIVVAAQEDEILEVHEALDGLAREDQQAADLVKLRYFVGMTMAEAADVLGLPLRTAERLWRFARAWLRKAVRAK